MRKFKAYTPGSVGSTSGKFSESDDAFIPRLWGGKGTGGSGRALPQKQYSQNPEPGNFPGGAVVKNPPASAGDTGSSPGPGRSHVPWSN